jgi:hypothetical protein
MLTLGLHLVDTTLYLAAQAQISFGHLEKEHILQATKGYICPFTASHIVVCAAQI